MCTHFRGTLSRIYVGEKNDGQQNLCEAAFLVGFAVHSCTVNGEVLHMGCNTPMHYNSIHTLYSLSPREMEKVNSTQAAERYIVLAALASARRNSPMATAR